MSDEENHKQVLRDSGLEVQRQSLENIDRVRANAFAQLDAVLPTVRPTLLITYGPPASGKGACQDRFFEVATAQTKFDANNYFAINIDAIVEQLDATKLVKQDAENYWLFRPAANAIAEQLLQRGLATSKPLVFETTGNSVDSDWYERMIFAPARETNYYILVAYPLVPIAILIDRAKERAKRIGRLPSDESIREAARNAAVNLAKLVAHVDLVVVFDNSGSDRCRYEILNCTQQRCEAKCEWTASSEPCVARCSEILATIVRKFGVELDELPCVDACPVNI